MENYLLGNQLGTDVNSERLDDFGQMISFPFSNDSALVSQDTIPYCALENKHPTDLSVNTQSKPSSQHTAIQKNITVSNKRSNSSVKNIQYNIESIS